jgi:CheY-like chemotaxis protein
MGKTVSALKAKGYEVVTVKNGAEALEKIKQIIPPGATVMNGSSVTLEQIGYLDYLNSGKHGWNDLHAGVVAEADPAKRTALRKQASLSDYYLGSVHALMENGEFIVASNTGSQLPHIVFTSTNLIFVVSTKKIVADFNAGMKRLEEIVVPLENQHMLEKFGRGTSLNKIVIFKGESPFLGRKIHFILVNEDLGY